MTTKYIIYIVGLLLIIQFNACTNQKSDTISTTTIKGNRVLLCDIDKITETREIKLSEIVEESEIIRLSNDTSALVGSTWLSTTSAEHLFLANLQNTLFLFDKEGKYIKSWEEGNGPNEFLIPSNPQFINNKVYVQDSRKGNLIEYCLNNGSERTIKIVKRSGISYVLEDSKLISVGNSTSTEDPFLVCLQDFEGNVIQSIKANTHINIGTKIVGEGPTLTAVKDGWNIHFPMNDTLFHYSVKDNLLTPIAVFQSVSNIEKNIKHYLERVKNDINISNEEFASVINVVPEYETNRYYFLSIYTFGEVEDMPWYIPKRKVCLVDKVSHEVFYANFVNDFWGNRPFTPQGNSKFWSGEIIQDFPAITIQKQFNEILKTNKESLDNNSKERLSEVIQKIEEDDNNIVFYYKLKEK